MKTIYKTLLILVSLFSASAFAQEKEYLWRRGGTIVPWYTDPSTPCIAFHNKREEMYVRMHVNNVNQQQCVWSNMNDPNPSRPQYLGQIIERFAFDKCPAGKKRDLSTGNCIDEEKKCKDPDGSKIRFTVNEGTGPVDGELPSGPVTGFPKSSPTCGIRPDSLTIVGCHSEIDGGLKHYTCTYTGISNGSDAPSNNDAGPPPAENSKPENMPPKRGPCPQGSVVGGMDSDGVTPICMGTGTDPSPTPKPPTNTSQTKSTDSDGNQTTTTTTKTNNSDGSVKTETTVVVVRPDGSVDTKKTESTSKAPDGSNGKDDKPDTDFCKSNPNLTVCRNSTANVTCGAVSCNGDAIQCATLQQAAAMRCAQDADQKALKESSLNALGQSVVSGNDPLSNSLPTPAKATNISVPTTLSSAGWLGAGACFPNKTISVMGKSFTLSFSEACNVLVGLRYALMVVASLVSFKILRGAFLSE